MKIALADDHAAVRKGLKQTLEESHELHVCIEASDGRELLKRLAKEKVSLLIMDISMPGLSGLDVLGEVKRRWSHIKVVIYTMHPDVELAVRALKAGALGYLTKDAPLEEMITAVKQVRSGERYVSSALAAKLVGHVAEGEGNSERYLSEREVSVMRMIAQGMSLKEIAATLSISAKTVSTYRTRILEKMKLRTNADLIRHVSKQLILIFILPL